MLENKIIFALGNFQIFDSLFANNGFHFFGK